MAALRDLSTKFCYQLKFVVRSDTFRVNRVLQRCMSSRYQPKIYTGNSDPAPTFIKNEVQSILKTLTRVDLNKVYRKRRLGGKLANTEYKFMTDEELQDTLREAQKKCDEMLQIPPIVKVRDKEEKIFSRDPALKGLDTARFVFTDISFGVKDSERLIVVREPDGTLKEAEGFVKHRMNQLYFPNPGRELKHPKMFFGDHFDDILNRKEYEYILDRACCQFEPDDYDFQRVVTIVYQHVNDDNEFEILRSTRHFAGLVFFLVWNKNIDNLLLDIIEGSHINEAKDLISLYGIVHNVHFDTSDEFTLIKEYIKRYATKKGALELALQAYHDLAKQKEELEKGIKTAHGYT